ncbi:hypothetical protein [Hydrogenophaga sp. Root209]|uniref:hypothetical protein n=1 Tax=Hydrogenophaga sp. Root209 TaxID=1736490 RepID=UPI0012E3A06C|nr:hypothetical protein [Hydrogenophaga sp. Root209]
MPPGTNSVQAIGASPISTTRFVQILPQDCGTGTLRVATLGVPAADQTHTFNLLRAPGPSPAIADLQEPAAFSCTISSAARSCVTSGVVNFNAGDAIELQWINSATVLAQAVPGPIGIAFSCN